MKKKYFDIKYCLPAISYRFKRLQAGILAIGIIVLTASGLVGSYYFYHKHQLANQDKVYLDFINEGWSVIKTNYWEVIPDTDLANLYQLAIEKITNQKISPISDSKQLNDALRGILIGQSDEEKKKLVTGLTDMVLYNLKPFGRSRLYTRKEESSLKNLVENVSGKDRYQDIGVGKDASVEQIQDALAKKEKVLNEAEIKATSSADKQQIAQQKQELQQSKLILTDENSKKTYDATGAEPTLDYTLISPRIFYLHLTKFSPTSLEEIQKTTSKYDQGDQLDTLILDFDDNIGGAIDGLPYFLGPFIGADQYAYQFYHQGQKIDFKTLTGWMPSLVRYKRVVILINENTQSTAEVMAAVLKKYNVGLLVGKTTKGWGTVEKVFPLENQISSTTTYSIFLVHSITLREDNQPIEGRGVDPVINISKEGWEENFLRYYNDKELLEAVKYKVR